MDTSALGLGPGQPTRFDTRETKGPVPDGPENQVLHRSNGTPAKPKKVQDSGDSCLSTAALVIGVVLVLLAAVFASGKAFGIGTPQADPRFYAIPIGVSGLVAMLLGYVCKPPKISSSEAPAASSPPAASTTRTPAQPKRETAVDIDLTATVAAATAGPAGAAAAAAGAAVGMVLGGAAVPAGAVIPPPPAGAVIPPPPAGTVQQQQPPAGSAPKAEQPKAAAPKAEAPKAAS